MQILDHLLGHSDSALFRRAQLKAFVGIHGKEVLVQNPLNFALDHDTGGGGAEDLCHSCWIS